LLTVALAAAALVAVPSALAWTVTMTATPKLKRTHSWEIEKSVSQSAITLKAGETAEVMYSVTATKTASVDSDWGVDGTITMTKDPDVDVALLNVYVTELNITDDRGSIPAVAICTPAPFPVDLGVAGMTCTYSASVPDAADRSVNMRARQQNADGTLGDHRTAQADFSFADDSKVTKNEIDESVTVTDSMAGALGTVTAAEGTKTFTYTRTIGPFSAAECGTRKIDNTAAFTTVDTATSGSASASVDVTVTCQPPPGPACTRTIGYWKTHAGFGPQADVVTPLLPVTLGTPGGAKSVTVTTAALAVQLLSMEGTNGVKSASNGINKLYAQLLAAKLNAKSSADTSSVAAVIAAADAFLATHDTLAWKSLSKAQQAQVNGWMSALDAYNNGLGSADHCD
jgi:hypothetical protein